MRTDEGRKRVMVRKKKMVLKTVTIKESKTSPILGF